MSFPTNIVRESRIISNTLPLTQTRQMTSTARLSRLHNLVEKDLDTIPPNPTTGAETMSEDDDSGGVALGEPSVSQPSALAITEAPATTALPPVTPRLEPIKSRNANTDRKFVWKADDSSSFNPKPRPKKAASSTAKLAPVNLKKGQLARIKYFSPILALSKYPYVFCDHKYKDDIASRFFNAGKFWARTWDLYYVWDLEETRPLILVGESQFEQLLKEINTTLDLNLRITGQQREESLVDRFPDHPRCFPRYLGRTQSKEEYDTMVSNVPNVTSQMANDSAPRSLDGGTLEEFKLLIEAMIEATKRKNKAAKEKKMRDRVAKQKILSDQFKRAQRYLGLRPCAQDGQHFVPAPGVDDSLPAPFTFDRSVVFICVDVEAYEKCRDKITEVGIATLDTRDLINVAPGTNGENWRPKIHARHFRIQENAHLVNWEFVAGCPTRFDWGISEFVTAEDAPAKIAECFQPPFAARIGATVHGDLIDLYPEGPRNLIFLGHDTLGDIKYIQKLGFDPLMLPNLLETQDTAAMFRVWKREQNPTKLGKILYEFDIPGFNLHNAGNDAVFTVQAMLAVCVKEATMRGTDEERKMREEQKASRLTEAQADIQRQIEGAEAGWGDHEQNGDGGEPELLEEVKKLKEEKEVQAKEVEATDVTEADETVEVTKVQDTLTLPLPSWKNRPT